MINPELTNLTNQFKAGTIGAKEYTEKYLQIAQAKPTYNTVAKPMNYDAIYTDPKVIAQGGNLNTNTIAQPVQSVIKPNTSYQTDGGSLVTSGQEDAIKKTPWALIIAVIVALIFID